MIFDRHGLLVELGCEELPARFILPALHGLRDALLALLAGVPRGEVRLYATPRRLAVAIDDLASHQPTVETEITGPPADRAFGPDGAPNETGLAFARGKGADPSTLRVVDLPKRGKVAAITLQEGGAAVTDLLSQGMAGVIEAVPFAKKMRPGTGTLAFGRPLQRVLVVYAGAPVSGEAHGFAFTDQTVGHRLSPGPFHVTSERHWLAELRANHVEPDLDVRCQRVRDLLDEAAAELGADPIRNDELVEEVTNLVEWPVPVIATFDEDLLQLPPKLLVTSMRVHQRYFPVYRDGALTHRFVVVANNPFAPKDVVAEGNARVLRARFFDARFFLREDLGKSLEQHGEKLESMRWIRGLGTVADKARRLAVHGVSLASSFGAEGPHVFRAARLAKCDLATQMVGEFPELQGHVGMLYARQQGEPAEVAAAIEEHYQPKSAGDAVAPSPAGRALAAAERLDTLVGCFGVGLEPKSSGDPQGLRRAAVGLLHTLRAAGVRTPLADLFRVALADLHTATLGHDGFEAWAEARGVGATPRDGEALVARLVEFTLARFKASQVEAGRSADLVDAVLAASRGGQDPTALASRLDALAPLAGTERFAAILTTFKRVLNILESASVTPPAREAVVEPEGLALFDATSAVAARLDAAEASLQYDAVLADVAALTGPIEAFFDAVLVNDPDPVVRARRQGLLVMVAETLRAVADFRRISTR
jgi:glycyl-tRNA synthetase beta chain